MSKSLRILFVHNSLTRFVKLDLELLREKHEVTEYHIRSRRVNPVHIFRQVKNHDVVFGWFASWHTFLPMLFAQLLGKPSLLIVGGYDVARMPSIDYGSQRGGLRKLIAQRTMFLADHLAAFSEFSRDEAIRNAGVEDCKISVSYLGVPDPFGELPAKGGRPLVLTVGNVWKENLGRKGLEPFVRSAAHLPDVEFVLVGAWRDDAIEHLRAIAAPNVSFTGWVEEDELLDYYRRAHVYVQASAHEGFGMSVAEAMLAGCIPVVTDRGSLPEVVGVGGVYIDSQKPAEIAGVIEQALSVPPRRRHKARNQILNTFPLEKRQAALEALIEQRLHDSF